MIPAGTATLPQVPNLRESEWTFQRAVSITNKVQLRRGFVETLRQTKTRRNPVNIYKTKTLRRQLQQLVRITSFDLTRIVMASSMLEHFIHCQPDIFGNLPK